MISHASIIIIGNEILSGRTQDKNMHWLASRLAALGIKLAEASIIPDIEEEIVTTLQRHRSRYRYVFTSGGIGPTHDDITSAAIAKAFNVSLLRHSEAEKLLFDYYGSTELSNARLKMAQIPAGASLIYNPISAAPGFNIENVWVMAGVPAIFQAMFNGFCHTLIGGEPIVSRSTTAHIAESMIAEELGTLQEKYPQLDIGSYPFARDGVVGTRLVISGTDTTSIAAAETELHLILTQKKAMYQSDTLPPA